MIKKAWKRIEQPTPKKLIRLGYALLGVFSFVSGTAIYQKNDTLAYIALGLAVIGKFLTDFFTEK